MTRATMKAKAPHPSGITGFNPGIATSSEGGGGSVVVPCVTVKTKLRTTNSPAKSIVLTHTHVATSP